jgi:hypothetical protein
MEAETAKAEANGAVRHGGIINSELGTETERNPLTFHEISFIAETLAGQAGKTQD